VSEDEVCGQSASLAQPPADPDPDQAWKALSLVNDWIKHSETKAGLALAATGVSGGVLYNLVKKIDSPTLPVSITAVLCGVAIVAAGTCAAAALIPRRKVPGQPKNSVNLLYYSDVARNYKECSKGYASELSATTSNPCKLTNYIADQVRANSIVASRKFTYASGAIIALTLALAALGVLAIFIGQA
jgi:hypothetical protein